MSLPAVPVSARAADGSVFVLPRSLAGWAVFLDVDGTLIDIAATPDSVFVPPGLPDALTAAADSAGGALALVSGRSIDGIDALFHRPGLAAAGLHGFQRRLPGGPIVQQPAPPALAALRPSLLAVAEAHPGALAEDKGSAIALHYRAVPAAGPAIEAAVRRLVDTAGGVLAAQPGKMVIEVRPAGASKGGAVTALAAEPPFAGRRLLAIGDDLTDEAMFARVVEAGGVAVRVGTDDRPTAAPFRIATPASVRAWLAGFSR